MPTITDSDAATSADSEVSHPPFPFWLPVITVTGQDLVAMDGTPLNGAIIFTPSAPVYVAGWAVLEGSAVMTVVAGVAQAPLVIPCTDAVTPAFTYTLTQRLATPDALGPAPILGVAVPHSLGASVDISQLL